MNINIRIIQRNSRSIRNKKEEFFHFLDKTNVHICLVCETWLNEKTSIKQNFYCYRSDRQEDFGCGLAIFIKRNIRHELIYTINNSLIGNIVIRVYTQYDFIDIFSCYFPGGTAGSDVLRKQEVTVGAISFLTNYN